MDIYIALVDKTSDYTEMKLLGRRVKDYAYINTGIINRTDEKPSNAAESLRTAPSAERPLNLSTSAGHKDYAYINTSIINRTDEKPPNEAESLKTAPSAERSLNLSTSAGHKDYARINAEIINRADEAPPNEAESLNTAPSAERRSELSAPEGYSVLYDADEVYFAGKAVNFSSGVFRSSDELLESAYTLRDGIGGVARYVAVIYSDMPLATRKALTSVAAHMKKNGAAAVRIGRGVMIDRKRAFAGNPLMINSPEYLSVTDARAYVTAYAEIRRRINERLICGGVLLLDDRADIDDTVRIAPGVRITGHVLIEGNSIVGADTTVGPGAVVRNSVIGSGCRIGDFVEIKASVLGDGVKAAHLAYIGDAEVSAGTNVGCGAVFCNYDGVHKHKTTVGARCFIGANVNLIAPVTVEEGCFIAAGTTVTDNLEAGAFCIGRARQTVKEQKSPL